MSTDGEGSGAGTSSVGSGGFVPYPSYDYYLNDLWYYNFTSGYWRRIEQPEGLPDSMWHEPPGRTEMVFEIVGQADEFLVVHAGFADNHYYNDMWFFDIEVRNTAAIVYPSIHLSITHMHTR